MSEFLLYFKMGLNHVLDFSAYDHILFLIVLAVVFSFNQFKKVIWLVTLFTIGHTLTLFLSAYGLLFEMNKKNNMVSYFIYNWPYINVIFICIRFTVRNE